MVIKLHSARLSFLRVLVPHRLRTRCALVPLVPRTPYDPMSLVPCALRALVFHCLTCLIGLVSYELSCLEWLVPSVVSCLKCSRASFSSCSTCFCDLRASRLLHAHVPHIPCASHALVPHLTRTIVAFAPLMPHLL